MQIGIIEFLETLDCDLVKLNIENFSTLDDLLDETGYYTGSHGTEEFEEEFKNAKENNLKELFVLSDTQLYGEVRGVFQTIDMPLIVDNVSAFVEDVYFNGIIEGCLNQTGKDIQLKDKQFETLLDYLDKNNENNCICSEYMHECVRAIVNPNLFVNDLTND